MDVSPLSRYPRHTCPSGLGSIKPLHRRDRLNPDFLLACTLVLPRSSNKTPLTIPSRRPHIHSPGTRTADAQTRRALYEFHNRLLWPVMSSLTSPALWGEEVGGGIQTHNLKNTAAFLTPAIFSACLLVLRAEKCTPHTHTHIHRHSLSESVGGYFYKGLFPKYTACPITDTLTASHVTGREASGHWLTVLRITPFKQHIEIICCFEANT